MRILITPDVPDWAIGNLTKSIVKHNPRFNWEVVHVHPRGIKESFIQLSDVMAKGVDFWHAMYWSSALEVLRVLPELKNVPSLLSHQNHHQLEVGKQARKKLPDIKDGWKDFNGLSEATDYGYELLIKRHENVYKIPFGIDLDRFSFIKEYPPKKPAIGYVGRVVPWKNLDKICAAARNLKYKVLASGYVEDVDYWQSEIISQNYIREDYWYNPKEHTLQFVGGGGRAGKAPANIKDDLYGKMTVFVAYSTGEKESGTLPMLEAMARGIPVMATSQGMARDIIEDGKNGIVFTEKNFEEKLKKVMKDEKLRNELRNNAWKTIRNFSEVKMARNFAKTYYDILWGDPVVSVIIPTYNRMATIGDVIASVETDDYPAKEIIVVDDNSTDRTRDIVMKLKEKIKTPLLYLNTNKDGYNLGMARNMGVIESLGSILLFLDDRFTLNNCLSEVAKVPDGEWHYGQKNVKGKLVAKKGFIENFSWVKKKDFVRGGMFTERVPYYGGMSQMTREQYKDKVNLHLNEKAIVNQIVGSGGKYKHQDIWKAKEIISKLYD